MRGGIHDTHSKLWATQLKGLLASSILFMLLVGCPNPHMHILFKDGSGWSKKYEVKLLDEQINIKLTSFSSLGLHCASYRLLLGIDIKTSIQRFPTTHT